MGTAARFGTSSDEGINMYLSQTPDEFYEVTTAQLWGEMIKPSMMPPAVLDKEIEKALATWRRLNPPTKSKMFKKLAIAVAIAVSVGAAAAVIGPAIAASSAASATAAGAGAVAGTTGASVAASAAAAVGTGAGIGVTGAGLTTAGAVSAIKAGAGYLSKGAAIYTKVTGKPTPPELMAAADLIENSDSMTAASEKALDYYLAQQGEKIVDERTRALVQERIKREQQAQAQRLRDMANQQAQLETAPAGGIMRFLPIIIPAGIIALKVI